MPLDSLTYSPTPRMDADGEILMRAADYIEKHGLCSGTWSDNNGRVCLVEALRIVSGATSHYETGLLCNRLGFHGDGNHPVAIVQAFEWSDCTPAEEVISRLRAAAQGVGR